MTEQRNGWTNPETWLVNIWLTNEPEYNDVIPYIIENYESVDYANELKLWVREEFNRLNMRESVWGDLLDASLTRVNWLEIIQSQD